MAKASPPSDTQVKVAKIGAMQAIIVTLITVAGASLGYFLGDASKAKSSLKTQQHWLVVKNVKYPGAARIVININGNDFSYPHRLENRVRHSRNRRFADALALS